MPKDGKYYYNYYTPFLLPTKQGMPLFPIKAKPVTQSNLIGEKYNFLMPLLDIETTLDVDIANLKKIMLTRGKVLLVPYKGGVLETDGNETGLLNEHKRFDNFIVTNVGAGINGKIYNVRDDKDAVLIRFDSMEMGALEKLARYAELKTEDMITMRNVTIMSRVINTIRALTNQDGEAAEEFMQQVEDGDLAVLYGKGLDSEVINSLPLNPVRGGVTTDVIELDTYLDGELANYYGLDAQKNVKRESLNENETEMNNESQQPIIMDIIENVKEGFARADARFGSKTTVRFGGPWAKYNKILVPISSVPIEETIEETEEYIEDVKDIDIEGGDEDVLDTETTNEETVERNSEESNDNE